MTLDQLFKTTIRDSLESATLGRCSRWTEKVRIMGAPFPGPWTFTHHPWLRALHDDDSPRIVIMKGAQLGFTEYSINRTLYTLDQLKRHVLYALPTERPGAMAFSKGRLNVASNLSPYLDSLFALARSEGHKLTRNGVSLYIRGSNSRSAFKETPASLVVLDELDEMSDEAIGLAEHRLDGQPDQYQLIMLSTPSVDGVGIQNQYKDTTQSNFFFKCPYCSKRIHLTYPESFEVVGESLADPKIIQSFIKCPKCATPLPHKEKATFLADGEWVPAFPDRPIQGYQINQLYSAGVPPEQFALYKIKGDFSLASQTEFYNSCLGQTFVAKGAQITDGMINAAVERGDYMNGDKTQVKRKLVTMGADIGQKTHHINIIGWDFDLQTKTREITAAADGQLLYHATVNSFEEIEELMQIWRPKMTVIDAQPETKRAIALCKQYMGIAYACYYTGAGRKPATVNKPECTISANRTYWIDALFDKFRTYTMCLPNDLDMTYRAHLKSTVKKYEIDDKGNTTSKFITRENEPDHFLHAGVYATIALGLLAGIGGNIDS